MTVQDYEKQGGFRDELNKVRDMGMALTSLEELMPARPHRQPEWEVVAGVRNALETLRKEILETRRL
jgi:hypothetical protein